MRRPHTLIIQRRKYARGSAGQRELTVDGDPITLRATYHPLSAEEIRLWGDSERETGKVFCRAWPGDIYNEITFRGEKWDQLGAAQNFDLGSSTKHYEIVIRKR